MTTATDDLNSAYRASADPFGYRDSQDDAERRDWIISELRDFSPTGYVMALDIGCGSGFITRHLPAVEVYGFDCEAAMNRLPSCVKRFTPGQPLQFDLICATGCMYGHYDFKLFLDIMAKHAFKSCTFLVCGITEWELPIWDDFERDFGVKLIKMAERKPYRQYTGQRMRIYDRSYFAQHRPTSK
jgi:SAM-dependent methyltransferase